MKPTYLSVLGAGLWNNRLMLMLLKVYGVGEVVGLGGNNRELLRLAAVAVGSGGGGEAGLSQHLRRLLDRHIVIVLLVLFVLVHTSGSRILKSIRSHKINFHFLTKYYL